MRDENARPSRHVKTSDATVEGYGGRHVTSRQDVRRHHRRLQAVTSRHVTSRHTVASIPCMRRTPGRHVTSRHVKMSGVTVEGYIRRPSRHVTSSGAPTADHAPATKKISRPQIAVATGFAAALSSHIFRQQTQVQLRSGNSKFFYWWQAQLEGDRAATAIWELEIFWGQQLEGDRATTAIKELEIFWWQVLLQSRFFGWQAQLENDRATTVI